MIADWPATLPRPERDTWQSQTVDARRKTQHDAGPRQYRRRLSGVSREVRLSVILTRAQKAVFETFWSETCAEGTLFFRMPDPTTDRWPLLTAAEVPVLTAGGAPVLMASTWLCAWGAEPPTETIHGQIEFRITFSVLVLP